MPVFTELLEKGRKREAFQLASTFVVLIVAALSAICVFFVLIAPLHHAAADRRRLHAGARRAHGRPVAGALPDRAAARPQRALRRDPQRLRPLHDPGARAAGVELRDHRRARRAQAVLRGPQRDVRLRDRRARGDASCSWLMCLPVLRKLGVRVRVEGQLPRRARPAGARPDAADHAQPGPHQLQPVHQLGARLDGLRGGAARDRRRLPAVHAAPGDVQRRGRDGPVPGARAAGHAARLRRPAQADRHRHAADLPAADPGGGLHARARRADHAPGLRARRVRPGLDRHRRRGAVLVLLQPAVRGRQPAADADVLLAAAPVAADRPGRGHARRSTSSSRSRCSGRSGPAASSSRPPSPAPR